MKRDRTSYVIGLTLMLLGQMVSAAAFAASQRPGGNCEEPLEQRAYVWQRVWTAQLAHDVQDHAPFFDALDVLGAEISFRENQLKTDFTKPNWRVLRDAAVKVGLVVRIGRPERPWRDSPDAVARVIDVCQRVLQAARDEQIEPQELEIDCDAATSQLSDYAILLQRLRAEIGRMRLVVTALPTWLTCPEFAAVTGAADLYVLQVHSLEKPQHVGRAISLFDSAQSRDWIEAAARLGYPFRAAMPAYGYRVGFADDGRFLGLQAEGAARAWPAGATLKEIWAEARDVARLVAALHSRRPAACAALAWFRFPCANDDLSWRWPTLRSVMRGEVPKSKLAIDVVPREPGTVDLWLKNTGADRAKLSAIRVRWKGGALIAGDGVGGWKFERRGANEIGLVCERDESGLRPGDAVSIGWIHLSAPAESVALILP